ncbi:uncharacterized protein [Cherax quadricarinatus]|uniref:uncharacterized protein n=1 Tax=Cherax quadricarinatus TaxID=27406 RepID=UPI00387EA3D9
MFGGDEFRSSILARMWVVHWILLLSSPSSVQKTMEVKLWMVGAVVAWLARIGRTQIVFPGDAYAEAVAAGALSPGFDAALAAFSSADAARNAAAQQLQAGGVLSSADAAAAAGAAAATAAAAAGSGFDASATAYTSASAASSVAEQEADAGELLVASADATASVEPGIDVAAAVFSSADAASSVGDQTLARQVLPSATPIFFPREVGSPEIPCKTYQGKDGSCRLLVQCATFFAEIAELSRSPCVISEVQHGVCCPSIKTPPIGITSDVSKFVDDIKVVRIDSDVDDREFEHDLDTLETWSEKWQTQFSVDKCKVIVVENEDNPKCVQ